MWNSIFHTAFITVLVLILTCWVRFERWNIKVMKVRFHTRIILQLTVYDKCFQTLLIGPLKKLLKKFLTSLTIKPAKQLHGHTYSTGMLTFNWNILVKNAKNIFFKHFMIFFWGTTLNVWSKLFIIKVFLIAMSHNMRFTF